MNGDHARSAALLASLAETMPNQPDLARKALGEAIGSGQMDLALTLAQKIPAAKLPNEARLLLAADAIKRNRIATAQQWLAVRADAGDLSFLGPLIGAWDQVEGEGLSPVDFQANKLPLLDQYLKSGRDGWTFRTYGLSAQGGEFD